MTSEREGEVPVIKVGIARLTRGLEIGRDDMTAIVREIMAGAATPAQIGGLLVGLAARGETIDEIVGAAAAMREAVVGVVTTRRPLIDTCGTGGSGVARRNVSTAVALAVAACGVAVAKHGNRGISSRCGSADVLAALGVEIGASAAVVGRCIDEVGVGFLFAPALHPAMRHAAGPRRELGVRTIFNLLGPLTNPAGVTRQVVGVFDPRRCADLAGALGALGSERVFVVHGLRRGVEPGPDAPAGIDDLSAEGASVVAELRGGEVRTHVLRPADAGLPQSPLSALAGEDAAGNAAALRRLLDGEIGPYRTAVQYSGALALLVAGDDELDALPALARRIGEVLDDGRARSLLDRLIASSRADAGADEAS
ncbi:MAG: anthranilate phosphoribosyltransferase [Myxococcales bacterium]|nr:anthranilate phosphoribosyltransferase [Myxococcales bacterium]